MAKGERTGAYNIRKGEDHGSRELLFPLCQGHRCNEQGTGLKTSKCKYFLMQHVVNKWDSLVQDRMEAESRAGVSKGLDTSMEDPSTHGSWAEIFPWAASTQ